MKQGLNASEESIDPGQPALSAQADVGHNFNLHRCERTFLSYLTHYHTILNSNKSKKETFCKCWSPFPTMFSTLLKTNFNIWVTFILSSVNAFNLDQSKIVSFGDETS